MPEKQSKSNIDVRKIMLVMPWILFLQFMQNFNENVFSLITPDIASSLDLTKASVSWVVSVSGIIFGICGGVYAALSDIISMRKIFIFGICSFSIGSIIGFASLNYELVIFARIIQSIGAGVIPGCLVVFITRYVPEEHKIRYIGYTAAIFQLSAAAGHYLGGIVATYLNWRLNFLLPVITLLCLPAFIHYLPKESHDNSKKMDFIGALLLTLSITSLIIAITNDDSLIFGIAFIFSTTFVIYSILREKYNKAVFISLNLFKNQTYTLAIILTFLLFGVQAGIFFIFPFIMADIHGVATSIIGYMYLPTNILAFLIGVFMGAISERVGHNRLIFIGCGMVISSLLIFFVFLQFSGLIFMGTALLLFSCGYPFIFVGMYNYLNNILSPEKSGSGFGIFNTIMYFAFACMPSIAGSIMTYHKGSTIDDLTSNVYIILGIFITILVISILIITTKFRSKKLA